MTVRPLIPALCLATAVMLASAAHADDGRRQGRQAGPPERSTDAPSRMQGPMQPPMSRQQRPVRADSLSDSVRRVQTRTGGQVLSAERVPFDGRDINRVKVVDERGRVRVYMDDPASRRAPRPTRRDDD